MAHRALEHLLQYGDTAVRSATACKKICSLDCLVRTGTNNTISVSFSKTRPRASLNSGNSPFQHLDSSMRRAPSALKCRYFAFAFVLYYILLLYIIHLLLWLYKDLHHPCLHHLPLRCALDMPVYPLTMEVTQWLVVSSQSWLHLYKSLSQQNYAKPVSLLCCQNLHCCFAHSHPGLTQVSLCAGKLYL